MVLTPRQTSIFTDDAFQFIALREGFGQNGDGKLYGDVAGVPTIGVKWIKRS